MYVTLYKNVADKVDWDYKQSMKVKGRTFKTEKKYIILLDT